MKATKRIKRNLKAIREREEGKKEGMNGGKEGKREKERKTQQFLNIWSF